MTEISPSAAPIGPPVDAAPGSRPVHKTYAGRFVDLVPLDAARHAEALWAGACGPERDHLWTYLFAGPFASFEALHADVAQKAASTDPLLWAIVDRATDEARGYAALMRIEPLHRVIEVGNILFAPALQKTPGATEAMALMGRIVFEDLGYRRWEWKCNALNAPSRTAALRLGFSFEGLFRQHMVVKGRNRDTAWFSMLDSEWPAQRQAFARWLDPANFDAAGRQRRSLVQCRTEDGDPVAP